ncbi:unnamed protein product [Vitrella brassicaformis CCMP3155]|uniref:Transmembrane protein n=1 Tax=Vitrella brassicaformis (strain CCMP3155) TaxID=1169540 RepID=A0A0G4FF54_VITBC|nr:unnamed protein product [Vitrella brassicaformis CCMP3155]|eukprot:CEM11492.1 unnamed protein product [Vitrella brassicaformis CCMP3155]
MENRAAAQQADISIHAPPASEVASPAVSAFTHTERGHRESLQVLSDTPGHRLSEAPSPIPQHTPASPPGSVQFESFFPEHVAQPDLWRNELLHRGLVAPPPFPSHIVVSSPRSEDPADDDGHHDVRPPIRPHVSFEETTVRQGPHSVRLHRPYRCDWASCKRLFTLSMGFRAFIVPELRAYVVWGIVCACVYGLCFVKTLPGALHLFFGMVLSPLVMLGFAIRAVVFRRELGVANAAGVLSWPAGVFLVGVSILIGGAFLSLALRQPSLNPYEGLLRDASADRDTYLFTDADLQVWNGTTVVRVDGHLMRAVIGRTSPNTHKEYLEVFAMCESASVCEDGGVRGGINYRLLRDNPQRVAFLDAIAAPLWSFRTTRDMPDAFYDGSHSIAEQMKARIARERNQMFILWADLPDKRLEDEWFRNERLFWALFGLSFGGGILLHVSVVVCRWAFGGRKSAYFSRGEAAC